MNTQYTPDKEKAPLTHSLTHYPFYTQAREVKLQKSLARFPGLERNWSHALSPGSLQLQYLGQASPYNL